MARHYRFLVFERGIDWRDVNASLLTRLNRLAMKLGKVITVTSGYRTRAEQARLYEKYQHGGNIAAKPGHSMHEQGLAVDATIGGSALNRVVSNKALAKYGLVAPVKGDPVHIQLLGSGKATSPSPGTASPGRASSASTGTSAGASPDLSTPQLIPPGAPPQPEETHAQVYAPGTIGVEAFPQASTAESWQMLAAQPLSSPETQQFAQRAAQAAGGQ